MSEEQQGLGVQEQQQQQQQQQQFDDNEAQFGVQEQQQQQHDDQHHQQYDQQHDQQQQYGQQQHDQQHEEQYDQEGQYGYYDDADRRSAPLEQEEEEHQHNAENMALGKIFVGGVSWQTNENSLRSHFEKFGDLDDVALMTDKRTGQPRGFGFVTFKDSSAVDVVLQQEHVIDGRTVDVKRAVPKDEAPAPTRLESKKVFVGGLAPTVTETEFREYFEAYGPVKEAIVMYDRQTNRSRGFGFITFDTEESVNKVMKDRQHEIMGKFVEVKRAEPRDARSSSGGGRDSGGPSGDRDDMYGGGMGMYGGRYPGMYGAPMRYPYGGYGGGRGGAGGPPPGGSGAQYPGFGAMGYYGGFPAAYGMGYGGPPAAGGSRGMYGYGGGRGGHGGDSGRDSSRERSSGGSGSRDYRDDRGDRSSQPRGASSDRSGPPPSGYRGAMMGMMPMGYGYGYGGGFGMYGGGPRPSSGQGYNDSGYGATRGQGAQQNRAGRSFRPY